MTTSVTPPGPTRRRRLRPVRFALIGGLAAGTGFAAVTGISAAAGSGPSPTSSTASSTHPGAPRPGRFHPPLRPGGEEGTITAVSGSGSGATLTLRTLAGTETVTTTASTKVYGADLQATTLSSNDVGQVVQVDEAGPSGGTPSDATIAAATIRVVQPTVIGRITAVGHGTYTLVGPDGQEITVTTAAGTTYYVTGGSGGNAPATSTTAPRYTVGEVVFASGVESATGTTSATSPTGTVQAVLMGAAPRRGGGMGEAGGPPHAGFPGMRGGGPDGPGWGPPAAGANGSSGANSAA